ncbi:MAG TPA: SDR family NAD(P)-dependent oxidoreductase [Frankiaceae bacterium]|jgi:NAD(P)-dependent dehydrogenase (short-subunit alcohol dehydrogenase family)|nr:SDR family NAD(P)-dependent oxidoreductase [Frankiaceae bacterium]
MQRLAGRVAVVTGAGSGIGLALVERLATEGVRVVMADIDANTLTAQSKRLQASGVDVHAEVVDVSNPDAVEHLGRTVIDRYGSLHIAINNAGIVNTGNSWELSLEEWRRVIDVDLWGVIHGIRTFVPLILATGEEGHVINTASMAAVIARPKLGPYTAAKHAVLGVSDVLRAELSDLGARVGVSVVMPGLIKTAMVPVGVIPAEQVALNIVDAIRRDRAYVFTDDHSSAEVHQRQQEIAAARAEVCFLDES